jgi:hypothetical protein
VKERGRKSERKKLDSEGTQRERKIKLRRKKGRE